MAAKGSPMFYMYLYVVVFKIVRYYTINIVPHRADQFRNFSSRTKVLFSLLPLATYQGQLHPQTETRQK